MRSARYAGEHASDGENLAKLLREAPAGSALRVRVRDRLRRPAERAWSELFEGRCARAPGGARRAGERGFGYDPAFLPDDGPPRG